MIKVQGYTRMRFVRGAGLKAEPAPTQSTHQEPTPDDEESGQYGRTARAWRRDAAREHGVAEEYVQLWERVLADARRSLSIVHFQAWLARTLLLDLNGQRATILVPNAFSRDGIVGRYENVLQQTLRQQLHSDFTLVYRLADE
jgi:hypothetical protein